MALEDIVLGENDNEELIIEIVNGTLNSPNDILMETNSYNGILINEILEIEYFQTFVF